MRITNRTRHTLVGARVQPAASFWGRLRGYIGRPHPRQGEGILLVGCDAIHTWWMSFDLDVLFLDEKGRVMEVVRSIRPWKRTRKVPGARYVLEVPAGTIDNSGTRVGDELTWQDPVPYTISVLKPQSEEEGPSSSAARSQAG